MDTVSEFLTNEITSADWLKRVDNNMIWQLEKLSNRILLLNIVVYDKYVAFHYITHGRQD